jgi:hypothetical protein
MIGFEKFGKGNNLSESDGIYVGVILTEGCVPLKRGWLKALIEGG